MSSVAVADFYHFLVHVAIVQLIAIKIFNKKIFNRSAALVFLLFASRQCEQVTHSEHTQRVEVASTSVSVKQPLTCMSLSSSNKQYQQHIYRLCLEKN